MKSFFVLLVFTAYLSASSDVCKIEWILLDGVKISPPLSMNTITLVDFDRDDRKRAESEKQIADLSRTPEEAYMQAVKKAGESFAYDNNLAGHRDKKNELQAKAKKFHGSDGVKLKIGNHSLFYPFTDYISLDDGRFGISYKSQDNTILNRLQDGTVYLKANGVEELKATCPRIEI